MVRPCICTKGGATLLKVATFGLTLGLGSVVMAGGPCGPDAGSCGEANGTPGCDDVVCCEAVCAVDPFCCEVEWDATCADEAAAICGSGGNDLCEGRVEIFEGATAYSTVGAGTDGLPHASCQFDGQTYQDIWFNFTAPADGLLTVSTCNNADYDTDLVVYAGCDTADCPPGDDLLIACNDDAAGCAGFSSEVELAVTAGSCYKIRVGGWNDGDEGNGTLTLSIGEPPSSCLDCADTEGEPCGDDTNGGCNSTPVAFGDIACGETVCGNMWADGGTRDTDWYLIDVEDQGSGFAQIDATLVSEGNGVVFIVSGIDNCAPVVEGETGSSENCESLAIASACVPAPGTYVVFVAPAEFEGLPCGGELNEYEVTVTCSDCFIQDPCNPDAGPCGEANGTPGCDDIECCETVCAADPFCCDVEWDQICADASLTLCGEPCDLVCDPASTPEGEDCGTDTNGGCNGTPVLFGEVACGETICGDGWADGGTRDTDWYLFETTAACTEVTGTLASEFAGVVFIVGGVDVCAPVVLGQAGSSSFCESTLPAVAEVGPGSYVLFVAPSGFEGAPCGNGNNDYEVTLECVECEVCDIVCDGTDEGEACGDDTNGGCNSTPVAFGSISCGETVCGTGWADGGTRDTDWYLVETTAECTELNAELTAEFDAVTFIVDGIDACAPVVIGTTGSSNDCVAIAPANAQVGPGTYVVFVAPSVFEGVPCGGQNDYQVTLTCTDCVPPDPIVNDNCEDRIEIAAGATDYDTTGANTDGLAHVDCDFDGQTYHDIWYNYTAAVDGTLTVSTCNNAAYDTDLAVYGSCDVADCPPGDDLLLACNDDFTGCAGFTSEVTIEVTCGECYKIRVGGWNDGDQGVGTLTLTEDGSGCDSCDCPDFDGDGMVGPADLAAVLADWNTAGSNPNGGPCNTDLDGSGNVGPEDLAAVLAAWGPCAG